MKTIAIYGMPVRKGDKAGRGARDYQDPETMPDPGEPSFLYHVADDVTGDDVLYYLRNAGVRIAPVDAEGNKVDTTIGIDTTTKREKGTKVLGRVALGKAIKADVMKLKDTWKEPNPDHHIGDDKEEKLEYNREWKRENPDKVREEKKDWKRRKGK